jgi:hypothetical protein
LLIFACAFPLLNNRSGAPRPETTQASKPERAEAIDCRGI